MMLSKIKRTALLVVLFSINVYSVFAGDENIMTQDNNSLSGLGLKASMSATYSELSSNPVYFLEGRIGLQLSKHWTLGLGGSLMNYDRTLTELSNESYRLEGGYTGIYVEYHTLLTEKLEFSALILSGTGLIQYRFDKEYQKDKLWYQEFIDRDNFAVFEPQIELKYEAFEDWWFGINASFRNTSPIDMLDTDEQLMQNFTGGITATYRIF